MSNKSTLAGYEIARQQYADWNVDTECALQQLAELPVSLQCWQADDVRGFESSGAELGGGLAVTGAYPGRARSAAELRHDFEFASRLIPGQLRINLHASYAETGQARVNRDELTVEHFAKWIDWAKSHGFGIDFNPTYFAHPWAESGWTLSHVDDRIRKFWIDHGVVCRRIAAAMGAATGSRCINNIWIPDGSKDLPFDRLGPRERLRESLDAILSEQLDEQHLGDAVECKLFGLGSESYVVGSHEFYLGYAAARKTLLCLDSGHFHPTEVISDKLSAVLLWVPELLLHVSRGVRWDSDHVVILSDEVRAIAEEAVRGQFLSRINFGLDFFDASINRVAAWVIGCRALQRALLIALLEPRDVLRECELRGDNTARLMLMEETKMLPYAAVWNEYCRRLDVPVGQAGLEEIRRYESDVLSNRSE
ncbi:MAG: L-rhamnose isomerase [Planctomycetales bacterium]|nr:L-rhamnose isomerase [Planctomycetales bacterium]